MALEQLLTPGARSTWDLGGGLGKWLVDQRGDYGNPLPGQGRVLASRENGGAGVADVAVVYSCDECAGYKLPDWPPANSRAVSARLTLERDSAGVWLVSHLAGSTYLADYTSPTRALQAAATNTAYAVSVAATQAVWAAGDNATATARAAGAAATRTAMTVSLNTTRTVQTEQWFPQPPHTPQSTATR